MAPKRKNVHVQVLLWPGNVDQRIVKYVERNNINPDRIIIHDECHITIVNEEDVE